MSMYFKPKERVQNKDEAIERLLEGIKKDYSKWSSNMGMIKEFNEKVRFTEGRKYIKILQGNSVWGFVAKTDGVLKGIPYLEGDVFKAAGWAAPAKHVRGSIYDDNQNWFHWTGPNYRF